VLARPDKQARRIDEHRHTGEDLTRKGVDLLGYLIHNRRRWRLFLFHAALDGDQRTKLLNELCPSLVILERMDQPVEFVGRDRRRDRLRRARRKCRGGRGRGERVRGNK
jgi:hypothetical protein